MKQRRCEPGGRVQTIRGPFADGLYVEAGAMSVHDDHDWTIQFARLCDVPLDPVASPQGAILYHLRGKLIQQDSQHESPWPLELTPAEQASGWPPAEIADRLSCRTGTSGPPRPRLPVPDIIPGCGELPRREGNQFPNL
jgi:Flavin containing amine oxidoreductase